MKEQTLKSSCHSKFAIKVLKFLHMQKYKINVFVNAGEILNHFHERKLKKLGLGFIF